MNITQRQATFRFGARRQLQHLLAASAGLLVIAVAIAVGYTSDWGRSDSSAPAASTARPFTSQAVPAQAVIYLVNSPEQSQLVAAAEGDMLNAIAATNSNQPLRSSLIIDVSTPEGQEMLAAVNADLVASVGYTDFYPQFVDLTR
jgi:hypothetical protein